MRYIISFLWLMVISTTAMAQQDTLLLEEVRIVAPRLAPYTFGAKVRYLVPSEDQNLNSTIAQNSAIYFKNYGNGQLSTIAFRGTSASHTAVLWNGVNINSPTLGQTDFSILPSYLLDDINIQFGSSSALYGSGALGGTISLDRSIAKFENIQKTQIHSEYGSYGHRVVAAKAKFSNTKFESQTAVYFKDLKNDFDIVEGGENTKQKNAAVTQRGINQQLSYKVGKGSWLELDMLYTDNHREIQPPLTNSNATDELANENLYVSLAYFQESGRGTWTLRGNYIHTSQLYNLTSNTRSKQFSILSDYNLVIGKNASIKFGTKATKVQADNKENLSNVQENRLDLYASASYQPKLWWHLSINLRQSIYSSQTGPLTPSLGQEIDLLRGKNSLSLKSTISRSYRIPTLNDRFWFPGGNPELLSEDAFNLEGALVFRSKKKSHEYEVDVTQYNNWANNWIVWLPMGNNIWTPRNLRDVHIYGLEFSLGLKKDWKQSQLKLNINYNYVQSINQKGLSDVDPTGLNKQLPYVPKHAATGHLEFLYREWLVETNVEFTGLRYSTLDNSLFNSVEQYLISDLSLTRKWKIRDVGVTTYLKSNNVTDIDYQNFKNYAMPGRNYILGININL